MSARYPIAEARGKLGELVRRAAQQEHITLTDRGVPVRERLRSAVLAGDIVAPMAADEILAAFDAD